MSGRRASDAGVPAARYVLLGSMLFLILLGLVVIYSASSAADYVKTGDSALHLKRQLVYIAGGLLLLVPGLLWDFKRSRTAIAWGVLLVSDALMVLVTTHGVGKWGAQRWLDFGWFTVQPSEWAKLGCVLVVADTLVRWRSRTLDDKAALQRVAAAVGPVVLLVMLQRDLGTTMVVMLGVLLLVVLAGAPLRQVLLGTAGIGVLGTVFILAEDYRRARFLAFLDPWAAPQDGGWQVIQALYAFGSGGPFGVGLGMSRQKFFYLPAAHTDFVFAIVGEELGLVGTLAVVAAFAALAWAGFRIAAASRDPFTRLVVAGLTGIVVLQAGMNMAAVTGLMPVTGIPLPFVSSGGSSMTFTMACVGLVLSAARRRSERGGRPAEDHSRTERATDARADERRRDGRPRLSRIDGGRAASRRRA